MELCNVTQEADVWSEVHIAGAYVTRGVDI